MSTRHLERGGWAVLSLAFAILTAWAVVATGVDGMTGFLRALSPIGLLAVVDLLLALLVGLVLMARDGRALGVSVRPYVAITLLTGSLGLLLYLARRPTSTAARIPAAER